MTDYGFLQSNDIEYGIPETTLWGGQGPNNDFTEPAKMVPSKSLCHIGSDSYLSANASVAQYSPTINVNYKIDHSRFFDEYQVVAKILSLWMFTLTSTVKIF